MKYKIEPQFIFFFLSKENESRRYTSLPPFGGQQRIIITTRPFWCVVDSHYSFNKSQGIQFSSMYLFELLQGIKWLLKTLELDDSGVCIYWCLIFCGSYNEPIKSYHFVGCVNCYYCFWSLTIVVFTKSRESPMTSKHTYIPVE